eukprot:7041082-Pyramimonas_sp.AAC.1
MASMWCCSFTWRRRYPAPFRRCALLLPAPTANVSTADHLPEPLLSPSPSFRSVYRIGVLR